ncbi:hypothetical protein MUK42_20966 [Musa troglodytarum]|uniref:Uncharacterized protein n=1 Tax=Musa troglodytarum TaxID=320322 RepID=A0A9E7G4B9_9LILI|nr:hypothetical protein MUK42_20966 [Musa troglodytarum]
MSLLLFDLEELGIPVFQYIKNFKIAGLQGKSGGGFGKWSMADQGMDESQPVDLSKHPSGIVPTLQNIVSTVNLDCKLDLKAIALQARNAEYNPKRFAAVIMRIREPKTTALIFASGKMVCTGAKSEHQSKLAARKYARIIQKLGFPAKFKDFKIQNIVGSCDVKFPIRLEGLAYSHGAFCSYEPELFPGLIYRMKQPKIVLLIFVSGKIVITGAKVRDETYTAFENIYPVLTEFRKAQQWFLPPQMDTLVVVAQHRNQCFGRSRSQLSDRFGSSPSRTFRGINCRSFQSGADILCSTPSRVSSFNSHPAPKSPCFYSEPPKRSRRSKPIPINPPPAPKGDIFKGDSSYSELWAGPAYSNSPPPSSLPIPRFSLRQKRSVSFELPIRKPEVSLRSMSKSAPSSPTRESTSSAKDTLTYTATVSATETLRRILHLDIADD